MIGDREVIDKEELKKNGLVPKVTESLQDHLLCAIWFSKDKKKSWLGQPFLIESLEKKFGKQAMKA